MMNKNKNLIVMILCVGLLVVASVPFAFALSISTNKSNYNRGETVTVTVSGGTANGVVAIQFNRGSTVKWADQGNFSGTGSFTYQLKIPLEWSTGTYTIYAKDSAADVSQSRTFGVEVPPPSSPPPPPPTEPPTVEDVEGLPAEEAADVIEDLAPSDAAEIVEELNSSAAADIIEEVSVEAAGDIIEELNSTVAADVIEEMNSTVAADVIEEVGVEAAAEIIVEMDGAAAAEVLSEVEEEAVEVFEAVEDESEEDAGSLLDAAVEGNHTEAFAEILLGVNETATAAALLASEPDSGGALVEAMAESDLNEAAKRVEAAVKLKARELTPAAQQELLERTAEMLEEVTVDSLVDLFLEIAGLPETPSTVAEVFEVMSLDIVLEVVDAWVSTGEVDALSEVFGYLSEESLLDIWSGMTVSQKVAVRPYLADETEDLLPKVVIADRPEIVVHLKGALEPDTQLSLVMSELDYVEWTVVYEEIAAADLTEAVMLIMVQADSSLDYTDDELAAVKTWYDEGGKTIWVAADSDYGNDGLRQATANSALEYLGSAMRIEASSTEDPVSNGGAPYRVLAVSDNVDPEFAHLVSGVERGLIHGPGIVIGYSGGEYVALETDAPDDVYIILTTSEVGVVVDNSEPSPEVHEAGDEGSFPVMALEVDYENWNTIIATGDAPFGQYMGLYKPEVLRADRYGDDANPQQGGRLFENIIDYVAQYAPVIFEAHTIAEVRDDSIDYLENQVSDLEGDKVALESDVEGLETEVSGLEDSVGALGDDVESLEASVAGLQGEIAGLRGDLEDAEGSAGSWRMYTVALLVVGLIAGYVAAMVLRKP